MRDGPPLPFRTALPRETPPGRGLSEIPSRTLPRRLVFAFRRMDKEPITSFLQRGKDATRPLVGKEELKRSPLDLAVKRFEPLPVRKNGIFSQESSSMRSPTPWDYGMSRPDPTGTASSSEFAPLPSHFLFRIHPENMVTGAEPQFAKRSTSESNDFGVAYDYGSVMHYSFNVCLLSPIIPCSFLSDIWKEFLR